MEAIKILHADFLDILFENRNKSYGAYQLRKTYSKRLMIAMAGMITIALLVIAAFAMAKKSKSTFAGPMMIVDSSVLKALPADKPVTPPEPPKLPPVPPQQLATVNYTSVIKMVKETLIPPPDMDQIDSSLIDVKTIKGLGNVDIVLPPTNISGTNVAASAPNTRTEEDKPFIGVEVEASFPGGPEAWRKYVSNSIQRALDEFSESDYGTVNVRFIVDTLGRVSDVQAVNMVGTKLAEVAVNAIRKGIRWIPARQNGRKVKAWRVQPVTLVNPY